MYKNKIIGIVVPAYNEELLLGRVIETLPSYVDKVIIVDDCSKDMTREVALQYKKNFPDRIITIFHEKNQGVGGAIASGYKWCRDENIDVAVVMAGDAQMDPGDLPNLLDAVIEEGADYAKGNRLFSEDAWANIPKWRYLGNSALSLLTKIVSGYWHIADSQSGYTAISLKALRTIDWDSMYKRYGQPNDLLTRLNLYNFIVEDVPIKPVYNIGEKSGITAFNVLVPISIHLARLFLWRMLHKYVIRDFHPLVLYYAMSLILLLAVSPILGVRLIGVWASTGTIPPINALALIFSIITGLQTSFFAMWLDMDYTNNKQSKQKQKHQQ